MALAYFSFSEVKRLPVEKWSRLGIDVRQDICRLVELEEWEGCDDV